MTGANRKIVFKLTTVDAWAAAIVDGAFPGSSDDQRDGFIHLSGAHQLEGTAAKYFTGVEDLCLVAFDAADLGNALIWEPSRGGEDFPHYYGALATTTALWVRAVPLDDDGIPMLPPADAEPWEPAS